MDELQYTAWNNKIIFSAFTYITNIGQFHALQTSVNLKHTFIQASYQCWFVSKCHKEQGPLCQLQLDMDLTWTCLICVELMFIQWFFLYVMMQLLIIDTP